MSAGGRIVACAWAMWGLAACAPLSEAPAADAPPGMRADDSHRVEAAPPQTATPEGTSAGAVDPRAHAPPGLTCLLAAYPEHLCGAEDNVVRLCDGRRMAWDDGRDKTHAERLLEPDLEDQMAQPYATGPASAPAADVEPGRVRHLPLFAAMYGDGENRVRERLTRVPWLPGVSSHALRVTTVNGVDKRLAAVSARIAKLSPEVQRIAADGAGAFHYRNIAGTDRLSAHAFGIAVDVGKHHADYWRWRHGEPWQNRIPLALVEAFEAEGFIWGGRWHHYDTMHFEYRPELLSEGCVERAGEVSVHVPPATATATPASSSATFRARLGWKPGSDAESLVARFAPPPGFRRVPIAQGDSFAAFLRQLPLRPGTPHVHLHDGSDKGNQRVHVAVVDIDVGARDLQQCADAVMRLRAEYLWATGRSDEVCFRSASGQAMPWARYRRGERPPRGRAAPWKPVASPDASWPSFRAYLDRVFGLANTASLRRELSAVPDPTHVEIGDVYIEPASGGMFGHAVLVVDLAEDDAGERRFLLVQSYMPAQEMHLLRNPRAPDGGPWFSAPPDGSLQTPEWTFPPGSLRRFGRSCR